MHARGAGSMLAVHKPLDELVLGQAQRDGLHFKRARVCLLLFAGSVSVLHRVRTSCVAACSLLQILESKYQRKLDLHKTESGHELRRASLRYDESVDAAVAAAVAAATEKLEAQLRTERANHQAEVRQRCILAACMPCPQRQQQAVASGRRWLSHNVNWLSRFLFVRCAVVNDDCPHSWSVWSHTKWHW